MKIYKLIPLLIVLTISFLSAQNGKWARFEKVLGEWTGTGSGFSGGESVIQSSFNLVMNQTYLEVKNESRFEPTDKNPEGEVHQDRGMISFDKERGCYVFRQFHNEGFVNQYVLNDSLSSDTLLVFESEIIENFVAGGKARFTIKMVNGLELITLFDVSFPGKPFACFGENHLKRKK